MSASDQTLVRLQNWYRSVCNGDWEHTYGVFIDNIDNPGWRLQIDLTGTYLDGVAFDAIEIHRENVENWLVCKVEQGKFIAYCGPGNLVETLATFLDWAEKSDVR